MAADCCCLCDAVDGKIRAGRIPKGGGVPLCAEHKARLIWESRQPKPVCMITVGSLSLEDTFARAALAGDSSLSLAPLAALAVPSTNTLQ
jgi:hypothetical protein